MLSANVFGRRFNSGIVHNDSCRGQLGKISSDGANLSGVLGYTGFDGDKLWLAEGIQAINGKLTNMFSRSEMAAA